MKDLFKKLFMDSPIKVDIKNNLISIGYFAMQINRQKLLKILQIIHDNKDKKILVNISETALNDELLKFFLERLNTKIHSLILVSNPITNASLSQLKILINSNIRPDILNLSGCTCLENEDIKQLTEITEREFSDVGIYRNYGTFKPIAIEKPTKIVWLPISLDIVSQGLYAN